MTTVGQVIEQVRTPVLAAAAALSLPVVVDNSPVGDFGSTWLRIITAVEGATMVQNDDRARYTGSMQVSIYSPRDTGDAAVLALADQVATLYRGWRIASPIYLRTTAVSLVGASEYGDGWSGRTVEVRWEAEIL